jgi:hypothetical protein
LTARAPVAQTAPAGDNVVYGEEEELRVTDPDGAAGYRPLPLDELRNAGLDVLQAGAAPKLGNVLLRGFPFAIGSDPSRCFVGLGDGLLRTASVPIDRPARWVIFAHRLTEDPVTEAERPGTPVADFRFQYTDGTTESVPIRRRFQISTTEGVPFKQQQPFLAVSDIYDLLFPRYEGRFEWAGARCMEVLWGFTRDYWIWAWENPRPGVPLRGLDIEAHGPRFVIAGITTSDLTEHPLRRPGARTVRVDISDSEAAAEAPITLAVEVDRGAAGYPYPLPAQPMQAFLDDRMRGFGAPFNRASSPAYVGVSALPSAQLTLRSGDKELGRTSWHAVETQPEVSVGPVRIRLIDPGRNWVRTEIVDADSGEVVPCRVHFRSPDGVPHPPHGHHPHAGGNQDTWNIDLGGDVRLGGMTYGYVDGTCEGWLPRGEVIVDVASGYEYEPLRMPVNIEAGQQQLRLPLRRMRDMNAEGWYSGDTHVHFLSSQGAQIEARGEGLNVVNLLLSQWGNYFSNVEDFTGEPLISRDRRTIVYANQENRQHMLGHLTLLGLKKPVTPWCTDGPGEAEMGGTLEVTMSDWADRCHEQGGTVILPHLPNPNGEPAAMIATGRVDAAEFIGLDEGRYNHGEYYRYLNAGYRLPLVGGTDKMTVDCPVGLYRTYVHIPPDEEFSFDAWCRNLARGRTFLSGGPLLFLRVNGAVPGDTVHVRGGGTVDVEVEAQSIFPMQGLELLCNGAVVDATTDGAGPSGLRLRTQLRIDADSWLAARVGGPGYFDAVQHNDVWNRAAIAHTSPVYVACGDAYGRTDESSLHYMLTLIEGSLSYVRELSTQHHPGTVTHHHGQDDHMAYLSKPFLEARQVLERRLRERR